MHISLLNVPVDREGGTSVFFFLFCVNQKTQEPSLGFFPLIWLSLWWGDCCGCTKHMHLTNIALGE